jgi:putative Ca2+/H+ antiporter (TMEM165/GDT1 family)
VAASSSVPAQKRDKSSRGHVGTGAVIGIVNCALGGVTAAYMTTRSVQVTLIAAVAAVLLVAVAAVHR